jgi:hypothetical protein
MSKVEGRRSEVKFPTIRANPANSLDSFFNRKGHEGYRKGHECIYEAILQRHRHAEPMLFSGNAHLELL